jgi:predicted nucleotidyltransferase
MCGIARAKKFSDVRLGEVRSALSSLIPAGELIVTCGSYARREASEASDMDYYTVLNEGSDASKATEWSAALAAEVERSIGKLPSAEGAFAANITRSQLLKNYGGSRDSNESITRRMLYLLEGEYLTEESLFHDIRREIIERYVDNTPGDHQVAFYLLNDVIRYWRTMAVDYAEKTYGASNPKPWAIRNIKLVFSRKLIYASGIFSIALTADRTKENKVNILESLFKMTPIDRIKYVCGESSSERLLQMYSYFLDQIGDPAVRAELDILKNEDRAGSKIFRDLKNEGHYFSRELMGLFQRTFHASHPIHMAVVF